VAWQRSSGGRQEKENGVRNYFAARGGDLVQQVDLVCLVYLVQGTK
jgi:hypothetical protein